MSAHNRQFLHYQTNPSDPTYTQEGFSSGLMNTEKHGKSISIPASPPIARTELPATGNGVFTRAEPSPAPADGEAVALPAAEGVIALGPSGLSELSELMLPSALMLMVLAAGGATSEWKAPNRLRAGSRSLYMKISL